MKYQATNNANPLKPEASVSLELIAKALGTLIEQLAAKFQKFKALLHLEKEYLITFKLEALPSLNLEKEKIKSEISELEVKRLELQKEVEEKWQWQEGQATAERIIALLPVQSLLKVLLNDKYMQLKKLTDELSSIIKENRSFIDLSRNSINRIQKNIIESLQGAKTYGREGKNSLNAVKGLNLYTNA